MDFTLDRTDSDEPSPEGSEAYDMAVTLNRMDGLDVVAVTTGNFDSAVAGAKVIVIPEQENASIADDIPSDSADVLYRAVHDDGATLILGYADGATCALVNLVFGHSLGSSESVNGTIAIKSAATSTTFEGGASTLTSPSATGLVTASSLPSGAQVIYAAPAVPP